MCIITPENEVLLFERLGIIGIKRNKINGVNGPSTYTVIRNAQPLRTVATSSRRAMTNCNAQSRSLEESLEQSPEETQFSKENYSHHSDEWRCYYLENELKKIDAYNTICVPHGWLPVNTYSARLQDALSKVEDIEDDDWRCVLIEAVELRDEGDAEYNRPRGAKLIRICWNNWNRSVLPF
jgi:hypothetical protein